MPADINVGLIGYKFMGKAHSNAYMTVDKFFDTTAKPVMKAVCGRDEKAVAAFAKRWGWESFEIMWQELVQRDDIDLVDIGTPGSTHAAMAIGAAQAGKHVFCEKPLAPTLDEARRMLAEVRTAGVKHMVNFNYRRVPAVSLAKKMIEADEIGEIRHARFTYLQDWLVDPEFPMNWRLRQDTAGSGAHGDLGAHAIDLAHFLVGDLASVVGQKKTFITERPAEGTSDGLTATAGEGTEQVTVDDTSMWLTKFANGAFGTFEATRLAPGRKNFNRFEINGSKGTLAWCFEDMNWLEYYSTECPEHSQGFRRIMATEGCHPYVGNWWPPGHILGYEHGFTHAVYDLLEDIAQDRPCWPDFRDGAQVVAVLDAVDKSIDSGSWADVEKIE
ncbi:Gfo/Idh/MocA family oxidoreductase [Aeoliella sp. ICT_H6.2]|uniref:Gfo/Idh/MocA family oxidoreductase n=1 Tax=Aeoliella straminimaris TaxID=2954799 RepID=A0A9X2FAU0_9BACT|nr:Gfo/Idh/MocA family oxidoreductase [Aeoliella straminimaris]MCO6042591.1 Gfo/Idh/MocA family oxidoreductase [Aeoliella straminimaris]